MGPLALQPRGADIVPGQSGDPGLTMLSGLWKRVGALLAEDAPAAGEADAVRRSAQDAAPVVWLVGKTGAGKTAIVAALTGDARAEVGSGFQPCTRTAGFYDVPPEAPLLRFLDTRGLAEAGYDPAEDIAWCEGHAHLLLAVMKLDDPSQEAVVAVLRAARRRHPDWPLVVAETGLHAHYPAGFRHPEPYPFDGSPADLSLPQLPHALRQALAHQRSLLEDLPGPEPRWVPVDLTLPDDGLAPADYGRDALAAALVEAGPDALAVLLDSAARDERDALRAGATRLIYGYAAAAGGAGAVPIPVVGLGGLAAALSLMLKGLAAHYDVAWTRTNFARFTAAVGSGTLAMWGLGYGVRELVKLIPGVGSIAGGALNAAAAFALAAGVGEAACVWLAYRRRGAEAPAAEVRQAFRDALAGALEARRNPGAVA